MPRFFFSSLLILILYVAILRIFKAHLICQLLFSLFFPSLLLIQCSILISTFSCSLSCCCCFFFVTFYSFLFLSIFFYFLFLFFSSFFFMLLNCHDKFIFLLSFMQFTRLERYGWSFLTKLINFLLENVKL